MESFIQCISHLTFKYFAKGQPKGLLIKKPVWNLKIWREIQMFSSKQHLRILPKGNQRLQAINHWGSLKIWRKIQMLNLKKPLRILSKGKQGGHQ